MYTSWKDKRGQNFELLHLNCKGKFLRETNYWTKRIWTRNLEEMVLYLISQDENNNVLAILSHVFLNLQKQLTGRQIPKRNPTMYVQDDVRKIAAANSSRKFCLIRSWYLIHPKSWVYTKYRVLHIFWTAHIKMWPMIHLFNFFTIN